jgi:hypothetical protein
MWRLLTKRENYYITLRTLQGRVITLSGALREIVSKGLMKPGADPALGKPSWPFALTGGVKANKDTKVAKAA